VMLVGLLRVLEYSLFIRTFFFILAFERACILKIATLNMGDYFLR